MVLLWRADDPNQQAGPSTAKMDGALSSDVKKFFFFFENVAMRGKSDEEKALELLAHLEGEAFDFYYETFAEDRALTEEAMNYALVKMPSSIVSESRQSRVTISAVPSMRYWILRILSDRSKLWIVCSKRHLSMMKLSLAF